MKALIKKAAGPIAVKKDVLQQPHRTIQIVYKNDNRVCFPKEQIKSNDIFLPWENNSFKENVTESFKFVANNSFTQKNPSQQSIFYKFSYFRGMPFILEYQGIKIYYYIGRKWSSYDSIFDDNNLMYINNNPPNVEENYIKKRLSLICSNLFFPIIIGYENNQDFFLFI